MADPIKLIRDGEDLILPLTDAIIAELEIKLGDDVELLSIRQEAITLRCANGTIVLSKSKISS